MNQIRKLAGDRIPKKKVKYSQREACMEETRTFVPLNGERTIKISELSKYPHIQGMLLQAMKDNGLSSDVDVSVRIERCSPGQSTHISRESDKQLQLSLLIHFTNMYDNQIDTEQFYYTYNKQEVPMYITHGDSLCIPTMLGCYIEGGQRVLIQRPSFRDKHVRKPQKYERYAYIIQITTSSIAESKAVKDMAAASSSETNSSSNQATASSSETNSSSNQATASSSETNSSSNQVTTSSSENNSSETNSSENNSSS